jgi:hypothetical protein
MFVLHRAFALCPEDFPADLGADYETACEIFGLEPGAEGYAVYLIDTMPGRRTLISRDLGGLRNALEAASDGRSQLLVALDEREVTEQQGWPDQLGGMPWCRFCRSPRPAWVYDGPLVEVLLKPSELGTEPWPDVAGTEISGRTDWFACEDCRTLIDAGDYDGLWHRCAPFSEPMPVQAAWRQFWVSHGPARPHTQPHGPAPAGRVYVSHDGWSPAHRKRLALELAGDWSASAPVSPLRDEDLDIDPRPYRDGLQLVIARSLDEAWSWASAARPPPGAVTSRRVYQIARLITATGRGWSLVARTDGPAVLLHDQVPFTGMDITGDQRFPGLLDGLTAAAGRCRS